MDYVNGGIEGDARKSKKALREAVAADPAKVYFYGTSGMGPQFSGYVSTLPDDGTVLQAVGPDPERKRSWYASIKWKDVKGVRKIVVE